MKRKCKRLLAVLLSTAMMLPSVLTAGAVDAGNEKTIWDRTNHTAETNTGDMNRIPWNSRDKKAVVDLEGGTWATPAIMDYDRDGYLDLILASASVSGSYRGTYIFYGDANSRNENSDDFLLMSRAEKLTSTTSRHIFYPTYLYEQDQDGSDYYSYDYLDTIIFVSNTAYPDFRNSLYSRGESHSASWPSSGVRAVDFSLVDYDGDGVLDLIRGVDDWSDYLPYNSYDSNGHWTSGPLHGWVMWAKNIGTNEDPVYADGEKLCVNNEPGNYIDTYGYPCPNFYDWDGDGDLDLVCGSFVDDVYYFENVGTRTQPCYAEGVSMKHANGENVQLELCYICTTSFDWNGDGYMDLVVGEEDGRVCYYQNTGEWHENGAPIFEEAQHFKAPADNLGVGILSTPVSVDFDGDGDEDLFAGDSGGFFSYFENETFKNGKTADGRDVDSLTKDEKVALLTNPNWGPLQHLTDPSGERIRIIAGPNGSVQGPSEEKFGYTVMSAGDWDGDNDIDLIANSVVGRIVWLENLGGAGLNFSAPQTVRVEDETPDKPAWHWWDPAPYELVTQWRTTPYMIDLPLIDTDEDGLPDEGDGLMDLVMVDYQGYLSFFERYEEDDVLKLKPGQRIFLDQNGDPLRLNRNGSAGYSGDDQLYRTKILLTDWDRDGRVDLLRNDKKNVSWMRNVGTAENPYMFTVDHVTSSSGSALGVNLHSRALHYHTVSPTVCDWNLDGVPDLIVGAEDGHFYYFTNKTPQGTIEPPEEPEEPTPPPVEGAGIDQYLLAHWDFEGEDGEELKDKATAGQANDDLTEYSNVTVANGVATMTGEGRLHAEDSLDLDPGQEMTLFFKAKVDLGIGTALTQHATLLDHRFFSPDKFDNKSGSTDKGYVVIWNKDSGLYGEFHDAAGAADSSGIGKTANNGAQMPRNEWREYAYVVSKGNDGKLTATLYVSNGEDTNSGEDFAVWGAPVTTTATAIRNSSARFYIGNDSVVKNCNATRSFEDVRVYSKALTPDELAQVLSYDTDKYLTAHWDFEGSTEAEKKQDKADNATASENADNLNVYTGDTGSVEFLSDGTVKISGKGRLHTEDSVDLDPGQEMTLFFRAKVELAENANLDAYVHATMVDHRYFAGDPANDLGDNGDRGYGVLWHTENGFYGEFYSNEIGNGATGLGQTKNSGQGMPRNEWREYAYVVSKGANGKLTATMYVSNGEDTASGEDFSVWKQVSTEATSIRDSFAPFYIGNDAQIKDCKAPRYFDDVRIYSKALNTDELAALITEETPDQHLLAHWDFEGENGEELKDKAPAGQADDDLTIHSDVVISDGVATMNGYGRLHALNSEDLNPGEEMTLFFKVKVSGEANAHVTMIDHRNLPNYADPTYGSFDKTQEDRAYAVLWHTNNGLYGEFYDDAISATAGQGQTKRGSDKDITTGVWREYAYVVSKGSDGKLDATMYVSKDEHTDSGDDFVVWAAVTNSDATVISPSVANFCIGNEAQYKNNSATRAFDDVRVYDKALTPDELAGLLAAPEGPAYVAPELAELSIADANLFPAFARATKSYTAYVAHDMEALTVRAAAGDAVITVNGSALNNGSALVALVDGANTITVRCAHPESAATYTEYTITINREGAGSDLTGKLVAKWDFEGTNEADKLADKGDNDITTNLAKTGSPVINTNGIILENGRAVYPEGERSYLAAMGNSELMITEEVTLLARVRLQDFNSSVDGMGMIDHRVFDGGPRPYAMFLGNESEDGDFYGIGGQIKNGSVEGFIRSSTYPSAELGEWATLAMVVKKENGNLVMYHYVSTCAEPDSGSDMVLISPPATMAAGTLATSDQQYLYIGNDYNMKTMSGGMEIEEVRIYNTALTMEQIAKLDLLSKDSAALAELMTSVPDESLEEDYDPADWAALEDALAAAQEVLDAQNPTEEEIIQAYWELDRAMENLSSKTLAKDYFALIGELQRQVNKAKELTADSYTIESWTDLQVAVAAAELVLKDNLSPLPSPYEITDAQANVKAAIAALVERTEDYDAVHQAGTAIEGTVFTVAQTTANAAEELPAALVDLVNRAIPEATGIVVSESDIVVSNVVPAVAGTADDPEAVNGSFNVQVAVSKGEFSLTAAASGVITATAFTGTTNAQRVAAAKAAVEGGDFTLSMATANAEEALKTALVSKINTAISASGITVEEADITITAVTPAVAGDADHAEGADGSYAFSVMLKAGQRVDSASRVGNRITTIPFTGTTNVEKVTAAKTAIVGYDLTVAQEVANDAAALKAYVIEHLNQEISHTGIGLTDEDVAITELTAAVAGDADHAAGSNGRYTASIQLKAGQQTDTVVRSDNVITATVFTGTTNAEKVAAAKSAVENADFTVSMATANAEAALKDALIGKINALISESGIIIEQADVTITALTPAVAGTADAPTAVNGSYAFAVVLQAGQVTATATKAGNVITGVDFAGATNAEKVAAAKRAIEAYDLTVDQAVANDAAALNAYVAGRLNSLIEYLGIVLEASDVTISVLIPATAGDADDVAGINGSYTVSVTLQAGLSADTVSKADNVITATPYGSTSNAEKVAAAKTIVEAALLSVEQARAGDAETLKAALVNKLNEMLLETGVSVSASDVTVTAFAAAVAGNADDVDGTNGSYAVSVELSLGRATDTAVKAGNAITATAFTGTTNAEKVAAAKSAIEGANLTVAQTAANTQEDLLPILMQRINGLLAATGVVIDENDVTISGFAAAVAGTGSNRAGTNGSYDIAVALEAGLSTATATKGGCVITATAYVDPSSDSDDDSSSVIVIPTPPASSTSPTVSTQSKVDEATGSTTVVETKADGTVVESTVHADGSTTKTETQSNGTVIKTETSANGSAAVSAQQTQVKETASGTTTTTTTTTEIRNADGTTSSEHSVEEKVETATGITTTTTAVIREESGATVTSKTVEQTVAGVGGTQMTTAVNETKHSDGSESRTEVAADGSSTTKVILSAGAIRNMSGVGETVELPMPEVTATESVKDAPEVIVSLPGNATEVKVEVPVAQVTNGTVAIIVKADGSEEIVKQSIVTETGVVLTLDGNATVKIVDNSREFTDVHGSGHWAVPFVDFAASRGLFSGTGANTFSPDNEMTRAMLTTVLASLNGVETAGGDTWYSKGQEWAVANGISDGTNPEGNVSREQMIQMLYRYAQSAQVDVAKGVSLNRYADAADISSWAKSAMEWAVAEGLISGMDGNVLAPQGNAARAQVATILMNFCKLLAK